MTREIIRQLDSIFKPRSVAVIGASGVRGKWGYRMIHNPLTTGYRGQIYAVNPKEKTVCGLPSYASVRDIPGDVEMAVIVIPAAAVPQAMSDCVAKGVRGVVMISAGFAETGEAGKALEDEVVRIARRGGIRFVGPNGMGILSAAGNLDLSFDTPPHKGQVAIVSQSGTYGVVLVELANSKGVGISKFISVGNQSDLEAADYLEYLADDEDTSVIIFYMEGFKDGRRFFEVAKEAIRKKPILIYKAGKTEAAVRATMSHTSSIAGSDAVFDAMCKQVGILRAEETVHLFDMAEALIKQPLPKGNRIAIIGSGGQGVVLSDTCESLGLVVPEFDEATQANLKKYLPSHAPAPKNPVDFAASHRTALDEARAAEALAQIDYIDALVVPTPTIRFSRGSAPSVAHTAIEGAEALAAIPKKYGKPVVTIRWRAGNGDIAQDIVDDAGIPAYDNPEQCARGLYALAEYARVRRQLADSPSTPIKNKD